METWIILYVFAFQSLTGRLQTRVVAAANPPELAGFNPSQVGYKRLPSWITFSPLNLVSIPHR